MKNEFLEKLASLVERYDVSIYYTTDDDGLHIKIAGDEVFNGWIEGKDCAEDIRVAKDT